MDMPIPIRVVAGAPGDCSNHRVHTVETAAGEWQRQIMLTPLGPFDGMVPRLCQVWIRIPS